MFYAGCSDATLTNQTKMQSSWHKPLARGFLSKTLEPFRVPSTHSDWPGSAPESYNYDPYSAPTSLGNNQPTVHTMSSNDNTAAVSDERTNFNCHGPEEAGSNKWESFCEWATGQPTMAPRAKKARGSRQAMWVAIHQARAAHRASHDGEPAVIEPPKWPLPDVEELEQPSAGPSYMPRTAKGKGSARVKKVTIDSNAERERVNACKRD
ncbi:hypothetical protein L211DRAFT_854063 [Terfezia boudieri ATCC MYA-4762]|uniref:Uncharacterized protein n=1 Tax=Terfezia boudieri ATCC MYA-4762 TaxID=1051890 RepID=A0A3N4L6H7_9PEZI|nr:hypothetical protein L211DRAFT_854063 [Terfezia boudieri ATCC MYA-4762]